jgi:hypothetical protein
MSVAKVEIFEKKQDLIAVVSRVLQEKFSTVSIFQPQDKDEFEN